MSGCPSKCPYVCPSICYMYELLLAYCYITKNLKLMRLSVCLKGIFVFKYKRLNCWKSGLTLVQMF